MDIVLANTLKTELDARQASQRWGSVGVLATSVALAALAPFLGPESQAAVGVAGVLIQTFGDRLLSGAWDAGIFAVSAAVSANRPTIPDNPDALIRAIEESEEAKAAFKRLIAQLHRDTQETFKVNTDGGDMTVADVIFNGIDTYFNAINGGKNVVAGVHQQGGSAEFNTGPGSSQRLIGSVFERSGGGVSTKVTISDNPNARVTLGGGGTVRFNVRR